MDTTRFAVLDDSGAVVNLIVAETIEIAREIVGENVVPDLDAVADLGDSWDGEKFRSPDGSVRSPLTDAADQL